MINTELVAKAKDIALNHKTLYVLGGFGSPATAANKKRWINAYSYNAGYTRRRLIESASADTFFFDCIGLVKGILWGWNGDKNATYGGAAYISNGVPDIGADYTITLCKGISSDFRHIELGEAVWLEGHIGIYIGDGLAIECSPRWADGVQITALGNIGSKKGYNTRTWTKHGKLPWVTYCPKGDIDFDGKVTPADARKALRAAVGLEKLSEAQKIAGDVDNDGKVTAADARAILNQSVNKE